MDGATSPVQSACGSCNALKTLLGGLQLFRLSLSRERDLWIAITGAPTWMKLSSAGRKLGGLYKNMTWSRSNKQYGHTASKTLPYK
ncbi:unnamed protein product [Eruca vesicaria subsp. sativa]|uniref:Uncharacterized protein n=1 Tax=Eruca vesicaria subsp. sativa TaxID=29727 RepID=A0ABC8JY57_ERUVS|nr:unnamed protein product [Eruca vesicaria subsp. sativa]